MEKNRENMEKNQSNFFPFSVSSTFLFLPFLWTITYFLDSRYLIFFLTVGLVFNSTIILLCSLSGLSAIMSAKLGSFFFYPLKILQPSPYSVPDELRHRNITNVGVNNVVNLRCKVFRKWNLLI